MLSQGHGQLLGLFEQALQGRQQVGEHRFCQRLEQLIEKLFVQAGIQYGFLQDIKAISQALQRACVIRLRIRQLQQPLAQRHEQAGEVAAVHCRDVMRCQWFEGERVVPVVEMPAIARQQRHAGQHVFQARKQAPATDIGEIMGGQVGQ